MELFDRLSDLQTISQSEELNARLEILLTDFLVCARAGSSSADIESIGARLAISSNYHDADDIDWSVMTHPGSIMWAALIDSLMLDIGLVLLLRSTSALHIERIGM